MLKLADLTGQNLKRIGGDNSLSAEYPYDMTQQWSAAVNAHPANVDGFIFVSKQLADVQRELKRRMTSRKFLADMDGFMPAGISYSPQQACEEFCEVFLPDLDA